MTKVEAIVVQFAKAANAAKINAEVLTRGPSAKQIEECRLRMIELGDAEAELLTLDKHPECPIPVQTFLAANKDHGCCGCWYNSKKRKNHPECEEKIERWFSTRKELVHYGMMIALIYGLVKMSSSKEGLEVNETVKNFARAFEETKKYSFLLFHGRSTDTQGEIDECSQRIKKLAKATASILTLKGPDLPQQVLDFQAATNDKPCLKCRYLFDTAKMHDECRKKNDFWFDARERLAEFGRAIA